MLCQYLIPTILVVLIPGEAIDEKLFGAPSMFFHCFLDQIYGNFDGNNLALKNDAID